MAPRFQVVLSGPLPGCLKDFFRNWPKPIPTRKLLLLCDDCLISSLDFQSCLLSLHLRLQGCNLVPIQGVLPNYNLSMPASAKAASSRLVSGNMITLLQIALLMADAHGNSRAW